MFRNIYKSPKLAIDLGTSQFSVWKVGEGLILKDLATVAYSTKDNVVLSVGLEAKKMLGKTPKDVLVANPISAGVIANYKITKQLLKYIINESLSRRFLTRPEIMLTIPAGCTQVERRALVDAALEAGAKKAYLIDQPLAAAIGIGVPIAEASGNMIVTIGAGVSEAVVISLGGVIAKSSIRVGGNLIDEEIRNTLRKDHSLVIGRNTAEVVKKKVGNSMEVLQSISINVKGRDNRTNLPKIVPVNSVDVSVAIQEQLKQIVNMIAKQLEELEPELVSDVIDKGILLAGAGAKLRHIDRLITLGTGVPCHVVENPETVVAKGAGIALENIHLFKNSLGEY